MREPRGRSDTHSLNRYSLLLARKASSKIVPGHNSSVLSDDRENAGSFTSDKDRTASLNLEEKLMLDEDRETGDIGWNVYKSFFEYYGGLSSFLLIVIGK
jgi:hypothetical protein